MNTKTVVTGVIVLIVAGGGWSFFMRDANSIHPMPHADPMVEAQSGTGGRAGHAEQAMQKMQHHGRDAHRTMPQDDALAKPTDGGTFFVELVPQGDTPPFNDYFTIKIKVFEGTDRDQPVPDARIAIRAGMQHGSPGMGHGMNSSPQITAQPDGTFLVEGLLFHMRGPWVLHVDVSRGSATERATFHLDCCGG